MCRIDQLEGVSLSCRPSGRRNARREIDADQAAGFPDRGQLLVGQIARMRADGMRVGVRGDQRRIAKFGNVPETAFVEMRQIDQNPQLVAGADQRLAEIGQARADIGRRRTAERHAVAERIRPAPDRTERAQPRRVKHVQKLESRINRFGALDMQHRRQHVIGETALDIAGIAANADAARRTPVRSETAARPWRRRSAAPPRHRPRAGQDRCR